MNDAKMVLANCWEQVHRGDPDNRETWTSKTLRWVCIWCAHDRPNHGKECPVPALAASEAKVEALERAVVVLYDDISDHLPDDILALVTSSRATLAASEPPPGEEGTRC